MKYSLRLIEPPSSRGLSTTGFDLGRKRKSGFPLQSQRGRSGRRFIEMMHLLRPILLYSLAHCWKVYHNHKREHFFGCHNRSAHFLLCRGDLFMSITALQPNPQLELETSSLYPSEALCGCGLSFYGHVSIVQISC